MAGDSKIYGDQEIIKGKDMMHTACGANPFQTTLNAEEHRAVILQRANIVRRPWPRSGVARQPRWWMRSTMR
ncbi:Arsenite oxidase subunit AioA [compost metagenome]